MTQTTARFQDKNNTFECHDWLNIREHLDQLPKPGRERDEDGKVWPKGWIFRGHKNENYLLAPTIERECQYNEWNETEYKALQEFQSKAGLHIDAGQLPLADNKLGWLAIMQHYGAPTVFSISLTPRMLLSTLPCAIEGEASRNSLRCGRWTPLPCANEPRE